MTIRFCINDILDQLEKAGGGSGALNALIEVDTHRRDCDGYPEDLFTLSSQPRILDIGAEESVRELTFLLDEVPLYRVNMELALDEALAERHSNATVRRALESAFEGGALPNTLQGRRNKEDLHGSLRHPMLGHMTNGQLCQAYAGFLREFGTGRTNYNFEQDILGAQAFRFVEFFDGYLHGGKGRIKAALLIGFGVRADHNPGGPVEEYADSGMREARKMRVEEPHELIWAWLEADHYQMRRCRDIHRMKSVEGLPRAPGWIKDDVLSLVRRESMKQYFAELLAPDGAAPGLLDNAPAVAKAVQANAGGTVDPLLQQLLTQILSAGTAYSGAASQFAEAAVQRRKEAQRAKLI